MLVTRGRLEEIEVQCFAKQIIAVLMFFRSKRIIHRDLKLTNILLSQNMEVKVCDFGLAVQLETYDERRMTICGTPNYIAPEVLKYEMGHSFEVDTWALGIILFVLLTGKHPFESKDKNVTYERIKNGFYEFPKDVDMSE